MLGLLQRLRVWLFRLSWRGTRIEIGQGVRFLAPVRISGRGRVLIADRVTFGHEKSPYFYSHYILLDARSADAVIRIGDGCLIGNGCSVIAFDSSVTIGPDCLLGPQTTIVDTDFHPLDPELRREKPTSRAVCLGRNITTGFSALILKGVVLADNCFVGAAAVVTRSSGPDCVLSGSPARARPWRAEHSDSAAR